MKTDRVLKISLLMFMVLFFFFHLFPLIYLFDVDFTSSFLYDRWNLSSTRNDGALLRHRVLADPKKQRSLGATLLSLAVDRKTDETVGILFPGWEVFVVADPLFAGPGEGLHCVFPNNATSPARFAGVLPSSDRETFICTLPRSARRHPYYQPMLTMCFRSPYPVVPHRQPPELLRWNYLAYDSLSTEDDVVLFVKGVNRWRRISLPPSELNCVFYDGDDPAVGVRTAVTSSVQEVFRCGHPLLAKGGNGQEEHVNIKITLEIPLEKRFVPSVAYYAPYRASPPRASKSLTCASTMVYNVAKFIREWVIYHSRIGVEQFILYDNGSDDDLASAVMKLTREGYDVSTIFWPWPKSQEAGFSHSAVLHNTSCTWMIYTDVDEFLYAPPWDGHNHPSPLLIESSILPRPPRAEDIGQVSIKCYEFGPSGQRSHPHGGVIDGYTCRNRMEQRHKSLVRLDAVDWSLQNWIHHFSLRQGFREERLGLERAVVNHYKFQAWPEFKIKFRRRASAYVADWTQQVNPSSKDRTTGLGYKAVEPEDWADRYCEVADERLKRLTQRWFGTGYRMPWD